MINRIEIVTGMAGLTLVICLIAFMGWHAATSDGSPAHLVIEVSSVSGQTDDYRVDVILRNTGDTTAANAVIEGSLMEEGGTSVEKSQATIRYLPSRSTARATLFFSEDPSMYDLHVRPVSYGPP